MTPGIYWFRRDLRLADNPALARALASHEAVLFVYIDETAGSPYDASRAWLRKSLEALAHDIRERGGVLHVLNGNADDLLPRLALALGASAVHFSTLHEPAADTRDRQLTHALSTVGVRVLRNGGRVLTDFDQVRSKTDSVYRVFTPFFKTAVPTWRHVAIEAPADLPSVELPSGADWPVAALPAPAQGWDTGFWLESRPGEQGAHARLQTFMSDIDRYPQVRDVPALDATSRLSAHLHFGEISPGRILATVRGHGGEGAQKFLAELGWREFAYYVLHHWPESVRENFNPRFNAMQWREDPEGLKAWQEGRTGVPLVDAGMRQLWRQGRMHNRVRMVVASWLTKHLGIHWRHGAEWFMHTLVDADLANNSLGWQWVAGTGVDAAPYFRIFNPVSQSRKFDPSGDYLRRWLPELAALDDRTIHAPWMCGVRVAGYPAAPNVDLHAGREAALARFALTAR